MHSIRMYVFDIRGKAGPEHLDSRIGPTAYQVNRAVYCKTRAP
jgi:hypothetical protein